MDVKMMILSGVGVIAVGWYFVSERRQLLNAYRSNAISASLETLARWKRLTLRSLQIAMIAGLALMVSGIGSAIKENTPYSSQPTPWTIADYLQITGILFFPCLFISLGYGIKARRINRHGGGVTPAEKSPQ